MKRTLNRPTTALAGMALAALLAALLAGCGGGADTPSDTSTQQEGQARALAASQVIPPLLDDEGHVYPSGSTAVPADPGARTRSGRYATAAQADQLEHALGAQGIPVIVEAGSDAAAAVERAVLTVLGLQAALHLQPDVPVLVRGSDLRRVATLVNRLEESGFSRVFLVNG